MARKRLSESRITAILNHFNNKCYKCGCAVGGGVSFHLDHVVPYALGGECHENNLWPICKPCHDTKTNKPHTGDKTLIARTKRLALKNTGYEPIKHKIATRGFKNDFKPRSRDINDDLN